MGEHILHELPRGGGLGEAALLLPPAAKPGEGLVPPALELGEAQLVEDLVDSRLRCHLGKTAELGAAVPGSSGHPAPSHVTKPYPHPRPSACWAPDHTGEAGAQRCLPPAQALAKLAF